MHLINGLIRKKQKKPKKNRELFKERFNFQRPSNMPKFLY